MPSLVLDDYRKALKAGTKEYNMCISKKISPFPEILDEILDEDMAGGKEPLGIMNIPLEKIAGTKTEGRKNAFTRNFLPLFPENSEFAAKWMNLLESQREEGIREPILLFEYMNHYYVQEGNKRVSVMKYLNAVSIEANVTRILPKRSNDPAVELYYEYVDFHHCTGITEIILSHKGDYDKLLTKLGKVPGQKWTQEETEEFHLLWLRFLNQYEKSTKKEGVKTSGDAFLLYLDVYPFEELKEKNVGEITKELKKMKKEFQTVAGTEVDHVMEPEEKKAPFWNILTTGKKLKVAFLYDKSPSVSNWLYTHELGALGLKEKYQKQVTVEQHICKNREDIDAIVASGVNVIFATTPIFLQDCVKIAIDHPEIQILVNAPKASWKSVRTYYMRLYESKFLIGILAGILSDNKKEIHFEGDYPIYNAVANINAFALGVAMVNPKAKVFLTWGSNKEEYQNKIDEEKSLVSNKVLTPEEGYNRRFGLYTTENGEIINIATSVVDWSLFYEKVIQQMLDGTWKKISMDEKKAVNYWWGLSSGALDLVCTSSMPSQVRRMVEHFKSAIMDGSFHIFEGLLYDQEGKAHGEAGKVMENDEIVSMNWLLDNIVGSIPEAYQLKEDAMKIVELQGVKGNGEQA